MINSCFLQHLDKRGTIPEVEAALVESTTFLKPSDPAPCSQLQSKNAGLQAEANELRSKNERLETDNEILKVTTSSLNQKLQEIQREKEEKEVELYVLTKANKNLLGEVSLRKDRYAILHSTHYTLQEKVAKLESDLALVHELRHKDAARVEAKLNALQVRRNTDKYEAEMDRNWVALKTRVNTLHEIQDGLDLSLAITEADAAVNSAREAMEQALSRNEEDGSEGEDAPPLS
uniref:Uncharacterized protein n=1 Tax=Solanum tuberosum TaxID=4113 RepID=M1ABP6_SOLTU